MSKVSAPVQPVAVSDELSSALTELNGVIERLVAPDGCPWDREQTPESLIEYLVEESFELVDAIRDAKPADICEELGDVAFLLLFLSRQSAARGGPSLAEAVRLASAKMIRRHPHVFGDVTLANSEELYRNWEHIKRAEKSETDADGEVTLPGIYDSLARGLPPLQRAYRIHSKAARVGFTWPQDEEVEQQVEAEWLELLDACATGNEKAINHEFGDHLFSLVELGRRKGIKASASLDAANRRFVERVRRMESLARERGLDFVTLSLDDKDELWNEVKAMELAANVEDVVEHAR